jgi:hypothetical protein
MRQSYRLLPALLACAALQSTEARDRPFVDDAPQTRTEVEEAAPWIERGVTLPTYPKDADLVEFAVDNPGQALHYFIDTHSITIGVTDQVVRYTLVIQSGSGVRNVSFEGLRCDSRTRQTYAFGTVDGQFRPLKMPQWELIKATDADRLYRDLRELYFCQAEPRYRPYPVAEIVRRFSSAQRYRANNDLF